MFTKDQYANHVISKFTREELGGNLGDLKPTHAYQSTTLGICMEYQGLLNFEMEEYIKDRDGVFMMIVDESTSPPTIGQISVREFLYMLPDGTFDDEDSELEDMVYQEFLSDLPDEIKRKVNDKVLRYLYNDDYDNISVPHIQRIQSLWKDHIDSKHLHDPPLSVEYKRQLYPKYMKIVAEMDKRNITWIPYETAMVLVDVDVDEYDPSDDMDSDVRALENSYPDS